MTGIEELQAAVEERYAALGMPAWPSPRPDDREPTEAEYSRVTDPGRYRIVHARARAWAGVLQEHLGAGAVPLDGVGSRAARPDLPPVVTRAVRLAAARPGTLPLVLVESDLPQDGEPDPLAVLVVAVADPSVEVTTVPDCGCDACDSGSGDLLEAVDDAVRQVVGGPFVALRGEKWHAEWHPEGQTSGWEPGAAVTDHELVQEWCRRLAAGEEVALPPGTTTYVGGSWLE